MVVLAHNLENLIQKSKPVS